MKTKKLLTKALAFAITAQTICTGAITYATNEVTVILDETPLTFDVPAQIIDGRTMVPMRAIFETLGATVEWNSETSEVSAYTPGILIQMTIGDTNLYKNTVGQTTDVPPQIVDGRTLVPLRAVSELMGADVEWEQNTKTVYINSTDNIQELDWNDNYVYRGEVKNSEANGYGMLHSKSDNSVRQLGKYINSKIVTGSDFFDNGETFTGNYEDGKWVYGTYYYSSGASYTGEWTGGERSGQGTYYYPNGSYHEGQWKNGLPNGYGTLYDTVEDVYYSGNYTDGNRNGTFTIYDHYLDNTWTVEYKNGELYDETAAIQEEKNRQLNEIYKKIEELEHEYEELDEWYSVETNELLEYVRNGDPFSTDWAKSIYAKYNVNSYSPSGTSNSGNIDSYASANAMRQNAALKAKADQAILEYNNTYIQNRKELIESTYNSRKSQLDAMKRTLELELEQLQ